MAETTGTDRTRSDRNSAPRSVPLPGGLTLRTARPGDLEGIGALLSERGEPADALDHRLVVEDPDAGWETSAVVVDGDRVVSTATLLDETVRVGDVVLPAGQVELVATARDYEGRGLVRALMGWAHGLSASRGHVLQVMIGIPYFYRLFGYEYAIDIPSARALPRGAETMPDAAAPAQHAIGDHREDRREGPGHHGPAAPRLRRATHTDIPALAALQDAAQAAYDVAVPHPPPRRRWLLDHHASITWVLDRGGRPVASARARPDDDAVLVAEAAADDDAAADDLLSGLTAEYPGRHITLVHRPLTVPGRAWEPRIGARREETEQYYARIPDPAALLTALLPVLQRRLEVAGLDRKGRDVIVSTFGRHYRIAVGDTGLGPVRTGGPMQGPGAVQGCGVAPDALPALLLGPHGMHGLTRRRPDVYPGPDVELFEALFPPLTADLLTYYLPW